MPTFNLDQKVAVVTGGAGVLCASMCRALAQAGAKVAVLDLRMDPAEALAAELGNGAIGVACDVLDRASIETAAQKVMDTFGRVDILINGAGGNKPQATTTPDQSFFDLPADALRWVFDLNLMGTILPCQVFGKIMAEQKSGVILNISSMNAFRPLTRIPAYSAAKAGVSNFTQWLAVHMAQDILADHSRQRHRPRLFCRRPKPKAALERRRLAHPARTVHHRPHSDGALWQSRRPAGYGPVAGLTGLGVRHRHRRPGGWRVLSV